MADDELVSQFLMITGSEDTDKAVSYLEMAAGNLEQAVSLFMDHTAGGSGTGSGGLMGGPAAGGGMMGDEVRAPDATQTMRLMDDVGPGPMMMGGMGMAPYMEIDPMIEERLQNTAFAAPAGLRNVRDAINAAAAAADDSDEDAKIDVEDDVDDDDDDASNAEEKKHIARLADMFAPPHHLMYTEGGFEGARTMAKDSKRWLLVNIQKDSEFSSHALNRDVWRDELVENLVREGFILWQAFDIAPEGRVYTERYKVQDYPHISIIDPRTRRLMWKKEGWTQQNPLTAESFAELAMDFCSRHSFDKPPQAPRPNGAASRPAKRPMHEMSEEEQIQEAMRASLQEVTGDDGDAEMGSDGDDDIEYLGSSGDGDSKPAAKQEEEKPKEPSIVDELLAMDVGDEPAQGARIQLRMPDGKRAVRKFDPSQNVKVLYAYIAQTNEEAKGE
eukprot:CAMPEP_0176018876 /NCGR_PEP_ID=MMETSP0120_2-20121206/9103_1 /TAXON_ID=160619 /ORGANISM="Kryptoperidinium foliaceum, Strain CCMP 1326" /LENGTH=443 /DNA_ID=CAMNT_0017351939 /DNA_START=79 /DNA_END=1410 /DNA_ORIENTATION=+